MKRLPLATGDEPSADRLRIAPRALWIAGTDEASLARAAADELRARGLRVEVFDAGRSEAELRALTDVDVVIGVGSSFAAGVECAGGVWIGEAREPLARALAREAALRLEEPRERAVRELAARLA